MIGCESDLMQSFDLSTWDQFVEILKCTGDLKQGKDNGCHGD